jgi:hypothetical protein
LTGLDSICPSDCSATVSPSKPRCLLATTFPLALACPSLPRFNCEAQLGRFHFSVFKYVTICQSCWSGNCDQEGMLLRILLFRNARIRLQAVQPAWCEVKICSVLQATDIRATALRAVLLKKFTPARCRFSVASKRVSPPRARRPLPTTSMWKRMLGELHKFFSRAERDRILAPRGCVPHGCQRWPLSATDAGSVTSALEAMPPNRPPASVGAQASSSSASGHER